MQEITLASWNWTSPRDGMVRRRHEVSGTGYFVLEHVATGRFIVDSARNVSKTVDQHLSALKQGAHKNKLFQELFAIDGEVLVKETPVKKIQQADKIVERLRKEASPSYLAADLFKKGKVNGTRKAK